jgi:hypothetical protein
MRVATRRTPGGTVGPESESAGRGRMLQLECLRQCCNGCSRELRTSSGPYITPVTVVCFGVVWIAIALLHSARGWRVALGSADSHRPLAEGGMGAGLVVP